MQTNFTTRGESGAGYFHGPMIAESNKESRRERNPHTLTIHLTHFVKSKGSNSIVSAQVLSQRLIANS